jgi:phthalate 4,5-dioxygenase oxygenase subunit
LKKAAQGLARSVEPRGLKPETHRVRSASFILPADQPFAKARADDLVARPGVIHTGV